MSKRDVMLATHNLSELKSLANNAKIKSLLKFLLIRYLDYTVLADSLLFVCDTEFSLCLFFSCSFFRYYYFFFTFFPPSGVPVAMRASPVGCAKYIIIVSSGSGSVSDRISTDTNLFLSSCCSLHKEDRKSICFTHKKLNTSKLKSLAIMHAVLQNFLVSNSFF